MPHEKQNAFTRMLGCKTYLHPIERSTLKTLFVEIFSCFLILFFLLQELDFIIYLVCWCLKHAIIDKRCVFLYFKSGDRPMALSGGNINRCLVYFMFLCFVFVSYFVFFNFVALWCIEGNKLYGREPEVEFVTHVTYGGSVKFFASGVNFSRNNSVYYMNKGEDHILS